MGKIRDLFKKMRHKGNTPCKDEHNKGQKQYGQKQNTQNYTKKDLNDLDIQDGVIIDLEPDILECEAK